VASGRSPRQPALLRPWHRVPRSPIAQDDRRAGTPVARSRPGIPLPSLASIRLPTDPPCTARCSPPESPLVSPLVFTSRDRGVAESVPRRSAPRVPRVPPGPQCLGTRADGEHRAVPLLLGCSPPALSPPERKPAASWPPMRTRERGARWWRMRRTVKVETRIGAPGTDRGNAVSPDSPGREPSVSARPAPAHSRRRVLGLVWTGLGLAAGATAAIKVTASISTVA
jgi:hypothetical protein